MRFFVHEAGSFFYMFAFIFAYIFFDSSVSVVFFFLYSGYYFFKKTANFLSNVSFLRILFLLKVQLYREEFNEAPLRNLISSTLKDLFYA